MIWIYLYKKLIGGFFLLNLLVVAQSKTLVIDHNLTQEEVNRICKTENPDYLSIADTNLDGVDIGCMKSFTNLQTLNFIRLTLTQELVNVFSNVISINQLFMSYVEIIEGTNFESFSNLKNLKELTTGLVKPLNNPEKFYKNFPTIEYLNIEMLPLTQEFVNVISNFVNLKEFVMYDIIFYKGVDYKPLSNLENVARIYIRNERSPVYPIEGFFKNFPNLEYLYIAHINFTQEDFEDIMAMKNLNELRAYQLDTAIDYETISDPTNIHIFYFSFKDSPFTPNFFKIFNKVEKMEIYDHTFNQQEIDGFKSLPNLKNLQISDSSCEDNIPIDFGKLNDLLGIWSNLDSKCILQTETPTTTISTPIQATITSQETNLTINNGLTQDEVDEICKSKDIESLSINKSNLADVNIECMKNFTNLKTLSLNELTFTEELVKVFSTIASLKEITMISVRSEVGVNYESLIKFENVTRLTMSGGYGPEYPKGFFKLFPNLDYLYLHAVILSQDNYEEIVAMKKLDSISFVSMDKIDVDYESISDTSNVRTLFHYYMNQMHPHYTPNFFKIFNKVESIQIMGHKFNQQDVDGLKSLPNLQKLQLNIVECENRVPLDFGSLTKILKIGFDIDPYCLPKSHSETNENEVYIKSGITQDEVSEICESNDPEFLSITNNNLEDINIECMKNFTKLNKIKFETLTLTEDIVNVFSNVTSLKEMIMVNVKFDKKMNYKSFINFKNITNLKILIDEHSKELVKYFPNLETLFIQPLKYKEELKDIVAMKNLKKLEVYLTNEAVEFESIAGSSSVRSMSLHSKQDILLTPNFFKIFSQIEELLIDGHIFGKEEVDGIKTLKNLKKLTLENASCGNDLPFDFGPLNSIMDLTNAGFFKTYCLRKLQGSEDYIYLYNANRNQCLRSTGKLGSQLVYGPCDNSDEMVWIIPSSDNRFGEYRSKANQDYCITYPGATLERCTSVMPASKLLNLYRSNNSIMFAGDINFNKCLGSSTDNPNVVAVKECNNNDPDQIWYYNLWDPSVVVKETAIVYFYNAIKNECIQTDGSSVTTGSCVFNDNTLWEIPNSHKGFYRSKANPKKCLSVLDGVVSLNECNENTTLTLDGNFIRSPSSKDHCIASSKLDNTLEYIEGCKANDTNHIWYVNIWTPPKTESTTTTTATATATKASVPTTKEPVPTNTLIEEESVPTNTLIEEESVPTTDTEEKPTMTITTVVTAIMTNA